MTYRDELNEKTSYALYRIVSKFVREGGDLETIDERLFEAVGDSDMYDERYKDALVDLIERLREDDLL